MNQGSGSGVSAVVLDWAGTVVDFGCLAPVECLIEVFGLRGVDLSPEEARGPMGMEKKEHIRALLDIAGIAERWMEATGASPRPADVDGLFQDLQPALLLSVRRHGALIAGAVELAQALRTRGVRIGSTTGYSGEVMEAVSAEAERQGFAPDAVVTPEQVPSGRPAPWMCFQNAMRLGVYPMWRMVKIGDTPADIREGLNAGMWSIGVTESGNEVGMTRTELAESLPLDREARVQAAAARLREAGAHYVTDGVWSCLPIIEEIEQRIGRGEIPSAGGLR